MLDWVIGLLVTSMNAHTEEAFRAINGALVLMRIWSVNILRFCGIVAKRRVVNATKDYLQINIKAPPPSC